MEESSKKPWLQNPAWASGKIVNSSGGVGFFWFFTLIWNGISSPVLFKGIPEMYNAEKYWAIAVMGLFPLIGLFLIYFSIYKTLQSIKYSKSILEMESMPGVIGGKLKATLLLPDKLAGAEMINVRLANIRQITTGSGKNRSTKRSIIWHTVRNFRADDWRVKNGKVTIPLDLTISYNTSEHDRTNNSNCVYWNLEVYSEMPGIDFATVFEVPVFKTPESDPEVTTSKEDEERVIKRQPHMKGITYQEINDGIRIFVHPFRFLGTGLAMTCFALVLGGISATLLYKGILFPAIIVSIFFILFFIFGIHFLLIQTEIVFYEKFGQIKTTWLGLGIIREFDLRDIKDIQVKVASQTQSDFSKDSCNYTLEFIPNEGKKMSLSEMTPSYDQALWMAAKLKEKIASVNN